MSKILELRQARAEKLETATALNEKVEAENRDFTADEKALFDGYLADADELEARAARLEKLEAEVAKANESQGTRAANKWEGKAAAHNKTAMGDNEERAFAAFIRGDQGALAEFRASNATDMNIGTDADGGYAVPTSMYNQIVARRDEEMLAEKLGVTRITGKGTTMTLPVDNEADGEFVSTSEANELDLDAPALSEVTMTLVKYTKQIKISKELLEDEDANLLSFINGFIARGMAKTHNSLLLTAARAGGTAALTLDSASTIGASEIPELVYKLPGEYADNAKWVMARATEGVIRGLASSSLFTYNPNPAGSDRTQPEIWGFPVYNSEKASAIAASAKSLLLGDWSYVYLREQPGLEVMRDPYSLAYLDQVRLLYRFRAVYAVAQAEALVYATHPTA